MNDDDDQKEDDSQKVINLESSEDNHTNKE